MTRPYPHPTQLGTFYDKGAFTFMRDRERTIDLQNQEWYLNQISPLNSMLNDHAKNIYNLLFRSNTIIDIVLWSNLMVICFR